MAPTMSDTNLAKPAQALTLRIGNQDLSVPAEARTIVLTRTDKGYMLEEAAKMGDSDVFIKRDSSGIVRLVYKVVKLRIDRREISPKPISGAYIPTVSGYNRLNQIAGVYPITPPTIFDGGIEHANPYVQYDDANEIMRVISRKIAVGYSPIGNLVAIDCVRHYNFGAYFLQDLQAKMTQEMKGAQWGTRVRCPFDPAAKVMRTGKSHFVETSAGKIYVFKKIKDIEGIWIDIADEDIKDVYRQHVRHQLFGEVIAQNMTWRNALKAHPAIAISTLMVKDGIAEVPVYGYRHEMDLERFKRIAEDITSGKQPTDVEIKRDETDASPEEVLAEIDDEVDETVHEEERPIQAPMDIETINKGELKKQAESKKINVDDLARKLFQTRYDNLTEEQLGRIKNIVESAVTQ